MQLAFCLLLACSTFKPLSPADRLNASERLDYVTLLALAPDMAATFASQPTGTARASYLDWFWQNWPAVKNTAPDSLRRLYRERAEQARRFYGSTDLLGDDRVRAYIRYGPPRREVFAPRLPAQDTVRYVVSPAEIWTYDSLGLQLDFVRTGVSYKLVGESRFGASVTVPALEPLDLSLSRPQLKPDARALDIGFALYRLGQQSDSVEVEIQYGLPLADIRSVFPSGTQPRFYCRIDFDPRGRGLPQTIIRWDGCPAVSDSAATGQAVALERLYLPADVYRVRIEIVAGNGRAAGSRSAELNLIEYARRAQPASDIVFYALADSTYQSEQFRRSGWLRLIPNCGRQLRSGSTGYLLYELYNLGVDSTGSHRLEADYDFIERSTRQVTFPASPQRFVTGVGATARIVERIHTMNLRPGTYLIVARANDLQAARQITLTSELEITPR